MTLILPKEYEVQPLFHQSTVTAFTLMLMRGLKFGFGKNVIPALVESFSLSNLLKMEEPAVFRSAFG